MLSPPWVPAQGLIRSQASFSRDLFCKYEASRHHSLTIWALAVITSTEYLTIWTKRRMRLFCVDINHGPHALLFAQTRNEAVHCTEGTSKVCGADRFASLQVLYLTISGPGIEKIGRRIIRDAPMLAMASYGTQSVGLITRYRDSPPLRDSICCSVLLPCCANPSTDFWDVSRPSLRVVISNQHVEASRLEQYPWCPRDWTVCSPAIDEGE